MIRTRLLAVAAAAGLLLSATAFAQQAYTSRPANVRAGPARDFPLIARLAPGTPIDVYGCLEGYTWCDIGFGAGRGWLSTRSMQTSYGGGYVPFYSYAPSIGLPIIGFSLFNYWDRWYRDRPFYRERPRWEARWRDYDRPRIQARPRQEFVPRQDYRANEERRRQQFEGQRRQQYDAQRRQQFEAQRQQQLAQPHYNREQRFPQRAQQQVQPPRAERPNPEPRLQNRNLGGGPSDPGREHQGQ
jgi:uncharacterized protein YraI